MNCIEDAHRKHREEIRWHTLRIIEKQQEIIMAQITALSEAVSKVSAEVEAAVTKLGEGSSPTQADVDALTSQLTDAASKLQNALTPAA
jgi:chromosome segregation ATPase